MFKLFDRTKKLFGFGYDAVESTPKRKPPKVTQQSEDRELPDTKRIAAISTSRDLLRNFAAAKWAVNKHLDYISTFHFQSRTGNNQLDDRIEGLVDWWAKPKNCDVAGRHGFDRITRLAEARATVDGDILLVKLSDGRIQTIEGDRIRTPNKNDFKLPAGASIVNGVVVGEYGETLGYCIHKRNNSGFLFEQIIPSTNCIFHGYFDRFDQVRGISPLMSGLNSFRDVGENLEYSLIKAKIASLFGLKFTRQDNNEVLPASDTQESEGYSVDFGKGAFILDMNPGDNAEFLESQHPSTQFQDFMKVSLGIALKSLDIPLSFYDEAYTNYSGARQSLVMYNQSANIKRNALRSVLNEIILWKLQSWIASGLLVLPNGMTIWDCKWEFVSSAIPWIDPQKEAVANQLMLENKLTSRTRLCKEQGEEFGEIIAELANENKMLSDLGLFGIPAIEPQTQTQETQG